MNDTLMRVHQRLGDDFLHPEFAFYTDLPLAEAHLFFPTEQEVRDNRPCPTGWMSGVEDGAINTGLNLEAQAIGFELTGNQRYVDRGRRLLDGLLRLSTCGSRGFMARSIVSASGTHYAHSSVDQYTLGVFGLWRIFRTGIPTAEQKSQIVRVLGDIADKFFRENGEITGDNGDPERNFTQGGPRDRLPGVERSLEAFMAAHSVSGEQKYLDYYHTWLNDPSQKPVPQLLAEWNPPELIQTYALWQTQSALRLVWEAETDPAMRSAYERAMRNVSRLCLPRLKRHRLRCDHLLAGRDNVGWRKVYENFEGWASLKELMGMTYYYYHCHPIQAHENEFVVNPLIAAQAILWDPSVVLDEARSEICDLLTHFSVERCRLSHSLVLFESTSLLARAARIVIWDGSGERFPVSG